MSDLDLKELDRLEREMQGKVMSTNVSEIHEQLRPLLYLVEKMGEKLEDAATALHGERAHEGRFWDCQRFGCASANITIKSYRRAKGE